MSRIHGANSSDYHKPHTVEDITHQNVKTIMHLEDAAKPNRDLTGRMLMWQLEKFVEQTQLVHHLEAS
jgi:hypothetical protein